MFSAFLRWGIPGLVTVVGGTALTVAMTGSNMASDLGGRSLGALDGAAHRWASVAVSSRDVVLSGTATDQATVDDAVARVTAVHGVRSVTSNIVLAEFASPYVFSGALRDGQLSLSGGVPDETTHAELLLATGATDDTLRLMSGVPDRAAWRAGVEFGLMHLNDFAEGSFSLADLTISISGRANSREAFDHLEELGAYAVPAGVTVGRREIIPPEASPYTWQATFDGKSIAVSGFTPNQAFVENLQAADFGFPVSTSLVLASGAPPDFERTATLMMQNLVQLESGSAEISDTASSLEGTPADQKAADSVRLALSPILKDLSLQPAPIDDYVFTAKRSGGGIVLGGFVPDTATRDRLDAIDGVDATALELARGEPERFRSGVDFGLGLLPHLSEGSFTLDGTLLLVEGRAATVADFEAIETTLALGAPQGLILSRAAIRPPLAAPFVWSAVMDADHTIAVTGFVPTKRVRDELQAAMGDLRSDTTAIADGAPLDFEPRAKAALAVLPLLTTGSIAYDGAAWTFSGTVDTPQQAFAADEAFTAAGLRGAGWTYAVTQPEATPIAALPVVIPYVWRAQKDDGRITLSGFVPTEALKGFLNRRAGDGAVDSSNLGAGAPEGFVADTLAGLDALAHLESGAVSFSEGTWLLSGTPTSAEENAAAMAALATGSQAGQGWQTDLSVPVPAEPVVTTEAPPASEIPATEVAVVPLDPPVTAETRALTTELPAVALETPEAAVPEQPEAAEVAAVAEPEAATEPVFPAEPTTTSEVATPEDTSVEVAAEPATEEVAAVESDGAAAPDAAPEPVPEEPVVRNFTFAANKPLEGPVALEGQVPAEATQRFFGVIAGDVPTDGMTVGTGLPPDFITNAEAGIRTLAMLSDGQFGLDGGQWVLNGHVETEPERAAVLASLATIPEAAGWETGIALLPPIDVCRRDVAAFAARNAIVFRPGSAQLAEESGPALDELTSYLSFCSEAAISVEGHTDADGDEQLNLALSVSRAEAVVNALIDRGVAFQRLYAVGYGESLPIASNDTTAGKQANRRIGFTLEGQQ